MADRKISLDSSITAATTRPAAQKPFVPVIDPNEANVLNRNKKMTLDELSQHYEKFTALSGTTWDGSNKSLLLDGNKALTFSPTTKQIGQLFVKQDATGSRTVTINSNSITIQTAANSITAISAEYVDSFGGFVFFIGNVALFLTIAVDTTPPTLSTATVETALPNRVVLTFNEALNSSVLLSTGQFVVTVAGSDRTTTTINISGSVVEVNFNGAAVTNGQTVVIDYIPGSNPILDIAGNGAAGFTNQAVTNNVGLPQLNTPGSFAAGTPTTTTIPLTWTDTNTSPNETGFEIYRNTVNTFGTATLINSPAANSTSYTATGLTAGTTYYFWIKAKGDGTTASDSNTATVSATTSSAGATIASVSWFHRYDAALQVTHITSGADELVVSCLDQMTSGGARPSAVDLVDDNNVSDDASKPKYIVSSPVNSLPAFLFEGQHSLGNTFGTGATVPVEKILVVRFTALDSTIRYINISATNRTDIGLETTNKFFLYTGGSRIQGTMTPVINTTYLLWASFHGDGTADLWVWGGGNTGLNDIAAGAVGPIGSPSIGQHSLGYSVANNGLKGYIAEYLLKATTELSSTDRNSIASELVAKYNIV